MKGYKKLVIYQKAKELVLMTYKLTSKYPKSELYTLVPQMRRASVSVLANIVEGYSRETSPEYARFLTISIASLSELEVFVDVSLELKFIDKNSYKKVGSLITENKKLLYSTRNSVRKRVK